jgi:biopolymer transport protein TolQ
MKALELFVLLRNYHARFNQVPSNTEDGVVETYKDNAYYSRLIRIFPVKKTEKNMEILCDVGYYQSKSANTVLRDDQISRSHPIGMLTTIIGPQLVLIASTGVQKASPFYAFKQSDLFGRGIVALLFLASIIAWTIMIDKWFTLKRSRINYDKAMTCFTGRSIVEFLALCPSMSGAMGNIVGAVCAGMQELSGRSTEASEALLSSGKLPTAICDRSLRRIRSHAEARVDMEVMEIESKLGFLSSIVSASPFLGLLGTVWGVMMAFSGMAMQGKADIKAIAPGVSGALLTTVVGLLVAIPAVIGYNILVNQVKRLTVDLDNFTEEVLTKLDVAGQPREEDA